MPTLSARTLLPAALDFDLRRNSVAKELLRLTMSNPDTLSQLNRLLTIEYRSLPMYLHDADPWTRSADEAAQQALKHIIADQLKLSQRIAAYIQDLGEAPTPDEFPMELTDLHFLSLEYLLGELLRYQRQAIADLEDCVAALAHDHDARRLAEEALGMERAHLESLEQVASQPTAAG